MATTTNNQSPPGLSGVAAMMAAKATFESSCADFSETSTRSAMVEANANTGVAMDNLSNINNQIQQQIQQEDKEKKWGWLGKTISGVIGLCLCAVDPVLGVAMLAGQAAGLSGLTKDIVGWISDGVQDLCKEMNIPMNSEWSKAIADIILVTAVVVAAVVVGVLTAGVGDAVIAEGAADVIGEDLGTEMLDMAANGLEDALGDAVGDASGDVLDTVADDTAKDTGSAAKDAKSEKGGTNRGKRGAKFGMLLGSQAAMQTNIAPNIVAAAASTTSNPDSLGWKIAEGVAFFAEMFACIGMSIGGACLKTPSFVDDIIGNTGGSTVSKIRKAAHYATIGLGAAKALTDAAQGYNQFKIGNDYDKMAPEVENVSLAQTSTEMINSANEAVQKSTQELEKSIYNGIDYSGILSSFQVA